MSGYANQTALFVPRIASLGHEVVIAAPSSYRGAPLRWGEHLVLGGARDPYGNDVLAGDWQSHHPDLLITLCDLFSLHPAAADLRQMNAAHWMPIDCDPAGELDLAVCDYVSRSLRQPGPV